MRDAKYSLLYNVGDKKKRLNWSFGRFFCHCTNLYEFDSIGWFQWREKEPHPQVTSTSTYKQTQSGNVKSKHNQVTSKALNSKHNQVMSTQKHNQRKSVLRHALLQHVHVAGDQQQQ
jgi:hypothetical protein